MRLPVSPAKLQIPGEEKTLVTQRLNDRRDCCSGSASGRGRMRWVAAMLAAGLAGFGGPGASAADDLRAEYAVRWEATGDAPAAPSKILKALKLEKGKGGIYRVQYFEADPPIGATPDVALIVRERVGNKTDVAWKYRGASPMSEADRKTWVCPLKHEDKRKDEVDVSIDDQGAVKRAYSRSCTSERRIADAVPTQLKLTRRGCKSDVTLLESKSGSVGVERWRLNTGAVYVEVSWKGEATDAALEDFKANVVKRLTAKGVKLLDRGMTEIATHC
jgi:hypothetical protein